jgi:hypothetical protein
MIINSNKKKIDKKKTKKKMIIKSNKKRINKKENDNK